MRFSIIQTVFFKELRELLRDRRSLMIMFGVPLVLYPALMLAVAGLAQSQAKQMQEKKDAVVLRNGEDAPKLVELLSRPDNNVRVVADPEPEANLKTDKVQAVVTVPEAAERRALAGEDVEIEVTVDRSRRATPVVEGKLGKLLREYEKWVIEQRLQGRGVSTEVLTPLKTKTTDVATGQQRLGNLMAQILPLFLLITGMLGAFFPALAVTTTEREHGTLETLLVTPAGRTELLIAKGTLVLLTALVTAGLNMLSMSLVMWRTFSMMGDKLGAMEVNPGALTLAYLAAVPTLIFFSAIVLVVGLLARTYREASSMATPVMLLPLASMIVGLMDPKVSPQLLMTPIVNTTVIIREVLTGRVTAGSFAVAFAASCLYAGLLVSAAARLFSNEQLVNSNWEPLSLKGLGKSAASRKRRRLPGIDEAVALWAVTVLLMFYVSPSLLNWPFLAILAVVQYGLLLAPTLGLAWVAKWNWRETFNLHRPAVRHVLGALVAAPGLALWASFLYILQNRIWADPKSGVDDPTMKLLGESVASWPVLTTLAVGLTAGMCEEFLYRGPIQNALMRRLRPWVAIAIASVLFSAAHMDLHKFPVRFGIGMVLGWVAWRCRSLWPAVVLHAVYDATVVGYLAWQVKSKGAAEAMAETAQSQGINAQVLVELAIGASLIFVGYLLFRVRPVADAASERARATAQV